jgi:hypothetical protein
MVAPVHQRDATLPNVVTVKEFNGARQITKPNTSEQVLVAVRIRLTQNPQPALLNQTVTHRLLLSLKNITGFVFLQNRSFVNLMQIRCYWPVFMIWGRYDHFTYSFFFVLCLPDVLEYFMSVSTTRLALLQTQVKGLCPPPPTPQKKWKTAGAVLNMTSMYTPDELCHSSR